MQEYADQVAALRPMLMRVARKRLRNDTWAEDAVSETLVAALEKPGAFAARSSLQTKLGVTTANLHVMLHRERSRLRVSVSAGLTTLSAQTL